MAESRHPLPTFWLADIVGHTTRGAQDEAALASVPAFQELARAIAATHDGAVVQVVGDSVLARFDAADSAVRAAVALQERFAGAARSRGWDSKLRIGVHLGAVDDTAEGQLSADVIDTAVRLREDARPGKVIVSEEVWRQLRRGPDFRFVLLHGVASGVQVYDVLFGERSTLARRAEKGPAVVGGQKGAAEVRVQKRPARRRSRLTTILLSGVGVTLVGVLALSYASGGASNPNRRRARRVATLNIDSIAPDSLGAATDAATGALPGEADADPAAGTAGTSDPSLGPPTRAMPMEAMQPLRTYVQRFLFRLSSRPAREVLSQFYPGASEARLRALFAMNEVVGAPEARYLLARFSGRGMRADTALLQLELLASVPGGDEVTLLLDARVAPAGDDFRITDLRPSPPER
jgi:class 3 adenylate cyclase